MYGRREFRFSYTDENGQENFIFARNEWNARKAVEARGFDPKTVKRAPVTKKRQKALTTCQICGRDILSNTGLIAHHGYTRPEGQGWQTASCFGARWRPYEVACDALPPAIAQCEAFIANRQAFVAEWIANPPATITKFKPATFRSAAETLVFERPADFNSAQHVDDGSRRLTYTADAYCHNYRLSLAQAATDIRHATHDVIALRKRLSDWRAPA